MTDADIYSAIYRAGYVAGLEAAAKVCEKRPIRSGKVAAAAIRALNTTKEK